MKKIILSIIAVVVASVVSSCRCEAQTFVMPSISGRIVAKFNISDIEFGVVAKTTNGETFSNKVTYDEFQFIQLGDIVYAE